jgi:predicted MPP superfamily phosphohydrolase
MGKKRGKASQKKAKSRLERTLSRLRKLDGEHTVLALLCSDIHLSHRPPVARSGEAYWYKAMARPLIELNSIAEELQVPVVIAGDIFDDGWRMNRCPPELINFAINYLPKGAYAIPGQHDLPHHRYDDIRKSAYWTLVEAGAIVDIPHQVAIRAAHNLYVHGFPWDKEIEPLDEWSKTDFHLAVIHAYIWKSDHKYANAPQEEHLKFYRPMLKGYDAAVFGDNHQGFVDTLNPKSSVQNLINTGTFMRRTTKEAHYKPMIGILLASGGIVQHHLDTDEDILDAKATSAIAEKLGLEGQGYEELVEELEGLIAEGFDFASAVRQSLKRKRVNEAVKRIVLNFLEKAHG